MQFFKMALIYSHSFCIFITFFICKGHGRPSDEPVLQPINFKPIDMSNRDTVSIEEFEHLYGTSKKNYFLLFF